MSPWDGKTERRRMNQEDHDLLIKISSDCNHMKSWTESHTKEDEQRHRDNIGKFDKIDSNDRWQNKILYGLLGVFVFAEFLIKFIK